MCCPLTANCNMSIHSFNSQAYALEEEPISTTTGTDIIASIEKKRVRFCSEVDVSTLTAPLDHVENQADVVVDDLWYHTEDLECFRTEVRSLCRQMRLVDRRDAKIHGESTLSRPTRTPQLARNTLTRGLEQRTCLERQRRKHVATQYIMKASRIFDTQKLALSASKCTAWAITLAHEEALRDFQHAYAEPASSKRPSVNNHGNEGRSVRARVTPSQVE